MQLAIETQGSGDPVLFIHGLGGTANVFGPQVEALAHQFSCVRFDLPGAGRSSLPGTISMDGFVDAACEVLRAAGVTAPVHVVGHSMGCVIALHLAVRAPSTIRSLALVGALHAPAEAARVALRARAVTARAQGLVGIADQIVAGGTSKRSRAEYPVMAAFVRELILRQKPEDYATHCEALAAVERVDIAGIEAPALLITGDEDATAPAVACRALTDAMPSAELLVLEACGHWATLERPREVSAALTKFLGAVR